MFLPIRRGGKQCYAVAEVIKLAACMLWFQTSCPMLCLACAEMGAGNALGAGASMR
ncbi:MAG: hypothetical protein SPD11_06870 [Sphaerochaetaceae bacterium]|nr:hypothetical protein [Sphaerochaetaceae bacterium]